MAQHRLLTKTVIALPLLAAGVLPAAGAADCFDMAAAFHSVNPGILRAIAIQENPKCDQTIRRNTNASIDVGCMQINSIHFGKLASYGVAPADLLDPCKNIYVGAWHYRSKINKHGNTWTAVGAYHSETPSKRDRYARSVYNIWVRYGLHQ